MVVAARWRYSLIAKPPVNDPTMSKVTTKIRFFTVGPPLIAKRWLWGAAVAADNRRSINSAKVAIAVLKQAATCLIGIPTLGGWACAS
jgi:hypothetical protein